MIPFTLERRAMLRAGTSIGLMGLVMPTASHAWMQGKASGKPPGNLFTPTADGFGMMGPWGEVRAARLPEGMTPYLIQTADKLGLFDYTGRKPVVTFKGAQEIRLTSDNIQIGSNPPMAWDKAGVAALKNALKKDTKARKAAMQMRSTIASSFAALAVAAKTAPAKGMTTATAATLADFATAGVCTTTVVTESVTTLVERTSEIIKSAADRYAECFDDAMKRGACGAIAGFSLQAGQLCAATYCGTKGFVDVVVGLITVVVEVVQEVVREVVTCTAPIAGMIPNDWNLPDLRLPELPIKDLKILAKDVQEALAFMKKFADELFEFLGPFGKCLISGKWTIEQLRIPFIPGVGIPYGVKVCITSACARQLAVENVVGEAFTAWGAAFGALAAFSGEFAAATGITATPKIAAAIVLLPVSVVNALAIILAFIILGLYYASMIAAQMSFHVNFNPAALADGEVCITHPSIALAVIKLASLTTVPAELVPPVVWG